MGINFYQEDGEPINSREPQLQIPFNRFMKEVKSLLGNKASPKGYSDSLDSFVSEFFPTHTLGEIVYKAVRYLRKRDPEDLAKIAAWAFLRWMDHYNNQINKEG